MVDDPRARMRRLQDALDIYLEHVDSKAPDAKDAVLDAHQELRELLEPMLAAESDAPLPKMELGDFQLLGELGRGGMGVVWRAEQISLRRQVALKLLPEDRTFSPNAIVRFRREAAAVAGLDHPNIVKVFATGTIEGTHFLAMELIAGASLAAVLTSLHGVPPTQLTSGLFYKAAEEARGPSPSTTTGRATTARSEPKIEVGLMYPALVAGIVAKIADALHQAHEHGILHRDVKPGNILLRSDGTPVLTDFGLALREDAPSLTRTGEFAGTPYYSAPEQIRTGRSALDRRTDVFSLGITLYELLTLQRPFQGDSTAEVLQAILTKEPADPRRHNRELPHDLAAITLKAIEKDPARRYASALDFANDLLAFLAHRQVTARRAGPFQRLLRFARREPLKAALALVLATGVPILLVLGGRLIGQAPLVELAERLRNEERLTRQIDAAFAALADHGSPTYLLLFQAAYEAAPENQEAIAGVALAYERSRLVDRALAFLNGKAALVVAKNPTLKRIRDHLTEAENAPEPDGLVMTPGDAPKETQVVPLQFGPTALDNFVSGLRARFAANMQQSRHVEAAAYFEQAVLLSPAPRAVFVRTWAGSASDAEDGPMVDRAVSVLERLWPEDRDSWFTIAAASRKLDPERAQHYLDRLTTVEAGRRGMARLAFAIAEGSGDLEGAVRAAEAMIEESPEDSELWLVVAQTHKRLKDRTRAIEAWEQARKLNPSCATSALELAIVSRDDGNAEESARLLEVVLADASPMMRGQGLAARGTWRAADGEVEQGLADLRAALDLDPNNPIAMRNYLGLLEDIDPAAHRDHLLRKARATPNDVQTTIEAAWLLVDPTRVDLKPDAASALPLAARAVVQTGARHPKAFAALAAALFGLGHQKVAVAMLEVGDERMPESRELFAMLRRTFEGR